MDGYLEKRGKWNTGWKKRYFWVDPTTSTLFYAAGKASKHSHDAADKKEVCSCLVHTLCLHSWHGSIE